MRDDLQATADRLGHLLGLAIEVRELPNTWQGRFKLYADGRPLHHRWRSSETIEFHLATTLALLEVASARQQEKAA